MADAALLKEVNIKTGIVKRLVKELACYKKEAEKEESKLKSMKADPKADEYLVKKQAEVLQVGITSLFSLFVTFSLLLFAVTSPICCRFSRF